MAALRNDDQPGTDDRSRQLFGVIWGRQRVTITQQDEGRNRDHTKARSRVRACERVSWNQGFLQVALA
jgi:hypothetical protein